MGLDDRRRAASHLVSATLWLGDGAEWAHSPNRAEGRGQHLVPDRDVNRVSTTDGGTRTGAGPDEGADRSPATRDRHSRNHGGVEIDEAGRDRRHALGILKEMTMGTIRRNIVIGAALIAIAGASV